MIGVPNIMAMMVDFSWFNDHNQLVVWPPGV